MPTALRKRCEELIDELGLADPAAISVVRPLTGGVASDIAMVEVEGQRLCIKFALPKLKVAEDWKAPVHRNKAEFEWLRVAADIAPESAVKVFGRSEENHGFAMEFLAGDDVFLWKSDLLEGRRIPSRANLVGNLLGSIHAASTRPGFETAPFQNRDDFYALRIEPYLVFTAKKKPEVAEQLTALASRLYETETVLVHGDVSPKNILFKGKQPVVLDAECATMGAPEFDVAFCLNHLILKAQHVPTLRPALAADLEEFWSAYAAHVSWETPERIERRTAELLPALMLARIDGKSPVEYLDESSRLTIREASIALLKKPKTKIGEIAETFAQTWKGNSR
ncbi:methylthioribose kinase [Labrenzia sp. THAF82]|uniref:phosphotransferase family protein n=1 Tax=Labrenzia sp. THAF82 TaxID=2587861 RepID=UPI00126806F6|nr:aminoglycoside phosphotransferase family protein [Labrenzia sp. THAF82]QFT30491.1 methylthioribose kinase [Labrenzia sp. THAF82]